MERFLEKLVVAENGCLLWAGGRFSTGYGRFWDTGRAHLAHRWYYQQTVRPLTKTETLDHACHNRDPNCNLNAQCPHRACVNPDHLEPKSLRANILAGKGEAAKNAVRTHCKRGHEFTAENTRFKKANGARVCVTCATLRSREANRTDARKEYNRTLAKEPKRKASLASYRAANREKIRAYHREHYRENRSPDVVPRVFLTDEERAERKREADRLYYQRNRERIRAQQNPHAREYQRRKRAEAA